MYANLCEPWDVEWCCDLEGIDAAIQEQAQLAASEVLWEATGRRFGNCNVTVRPCRSDCFDQLQRPVTTYSAIGWPYPTLHDGEWINIGCGTCAGDCACSATSEVLFPDPVQITSVIVDGEALPINAWVLYDGTRLVRLTGDWPLCQDWSVTGGPGTFNVTLRVGVDVPMLGKQAVSALACELARFCSGQDCDLPPHVTQVVRSGVTMTRLDPQQLLDAGLTGLFLPDLFIRTFNPSGIRDRARAFSPDVPLPRLQSME